MSQFQDVSKLILATKTPFTVKENIRARPDLVVKNAWFSRWFPLEHD